MREFFDAWSRGDAATVARVSVLKSSGVSEAGIVWDQKALASLLSLPESRQLMTNVKITDTTTQSGTTTVTVTMRYNGVPYFMRLGVRQVQGRWQVAMPPSMLNVTFPSDDSTVVIDGVPVHGAAGHVLTLDVYPGAHHVHMDGSAIVAAVDTVTTPVEPYKTQDVSPTQALTPTAVAAAHQAIHTWLTTCAASTNLHPGQSCPQYVIGTGTIANVHWTLTKDGSDATVDLATLTTATATGSWAMTVAWDETSRGYTEHQQEDTGMSFTVTLTWNGSGFDVQPLQ